MLEIPLVISYRDTEPSARLQALIEEKVHRLEVRFDHLVGCQITIERAVARGRHSAWRVRIELSVPNEHITVAHEPGARDDHESLYQAVRDAFSAAERRLLDYKGRIGNRTKTHVGPPVGVVVGVSAGGTQPGSGHGFIATRDGRELYFHEHAVVDGQFDELRPGTEVRFAEDDHDIGPHVTTLHPTR